LSSTGTINSPVTEQAYATLAPGGVTNIGTLTINNMILLNGNAFFRISKNGGVITNDQVKGMTGEVYTDTTLIVTNITTDGTPLAAVDTFLLSNRASGSFTGEVLYFDLPSLPTTLVWDVSAIESDGILSVAELPVITNQPQSLAVNPGSPASFSVGATGTGPLNFQWQKNGADIGGAATSSYTIPGVTTNDAGNYTVVITNDYGAVTSQVAVLTVNVAPVMGSVSMVMGSGFSLTATGSVGQTCVLFGATNLASPVAWLPVATNTADANGILHFTDPSATNKPQRFYRLQTP
jgi:hypothetical protein